MRDVDYQWLARIHYSTATDGTRTYLIPDDVARRLTSEGLIRRATPTTSWALTWHECTTPGRNRVTGAVRAATRALPATTGDPW